MALHGSEFGYNLSVSVWHYLDAIDIEGHVVLPRLEPGKRHPPAPPVLCQAGRHSGGRSRGAFTINLKLSTIISETQG